jgi:tRNA dimethylallyltransferase
LERTALYRRIDERVDRMIAAGLVDEVRSLLERGYAWNLPAMSSLGYKEFRPLFEGTARTEACVERLKFNTHAFARKQDMWFRRLPNVAQIDAACDNVVAQALAAIHLA